MSRTKKTNDKKGNKYQVFSKVSKSSDGTESSNAVVTGRCPACGGVAGSVPGKQNLCRDCYFGTNGHKKLGKPKRA